MRSGGADGVVVEVGEIHREIGGAEHSGPCPQLQRGGRSRWGLAARRRGRLPLGQHAEHRVDVVAGSATDNRAASVSHPTILADRTPNRSFR